MNDPDSLLTLAAAGFAALGLASVALLKAWNGWLALKRLELGGDGQASSRGRSEVARLRERVRRLEAIANGAEL